MKAQEINRLLFVLMLIVFAALTRILPHWPNFTAVGAMGLLAACYMRPSVLAVFTTVAVLYISDLYINNVMYAGYYDHFTWKISPFVYLAFLLVLGIGFWLRNSINASRLLVASLGASVAFFLLTNAASWYIAPANVYSKDLTGLLAAYTAGLPFFGNTLLGDLFYCALFFGAYQFVGAKWFALDRTPRA